LQSSTSSEKRSAQTHLEARTEFYGEFTPWR
jgi:hypothetical protein